MCVFEHTIKGIYNGCDSNRSCLCVTVICEAKCKHIRVVPCRIIPCRAVPYRESWRVCACLCWLTMIFASLVAHSHNMLIRKFASACCCCHSVIYSLCCYLFLWWNCSSHVWADTNTLTLICVWADLSLFRALFQPLDAQLLFSLRSALNFKTKTYTRTLSLSISQRWNRNNA